SAVKEAFNVSDSFIRVCSSCFSLLISICALLASALAVVVSRTTRINPISDTKRMIAVKAHGRIRLLNGFEAKLRLLFTGRNSSLRAYRQANFGEAYTS